MNISRLRQNRDSLKTKIKALEQSIDGASKALGRHKIALMQAEKDIATAKMFNAELVITDHAIVRYLERVLEMDITELKRKIVPKDTLERINANPTINKVIVKSELGTYHLLISDGIITTIITK